jgi:hypothetical protein
VIGDLVILAISFDQEKIWKSRERTHDRESRTFWDKLQNLLF